MFRRYSHSKKLKILLVFCSLNRTFAPVMTPQEYIQLKAFARQDGALLSLMWIGAFVCYIQGLTYPMLGMAAMVFIFGSPFFAASRLRHFRDYAREGIISFSRSYAYTVLIFFYAGILFAVAVFLYFAFLDHGFLLSKIMETVQSTEGRQMIQMYGMEKDVNDSLKTLSELRPIDYALNMLTINIITGFILGLPIAALMQKNVKTLKN